MKFIDTITASVRLVREMQHTIIRKSRKLLIRSTFHEEKINRIFRRETLQLLLIIKGIYGEGCFRLTRDEAGQSVGISLVSAENGEYLFHV